MARSGYAESFTSYLHTISERSLLTHAQEQRLGRRVQAGCPRAKRELVEHNMRLVVFAAKRHRGLGVDLEELVQEGALGLYRAAEKFDPEKGYRFSTYATWWVRQATGKAVANLARPVRLPVHIQERLRALREAEAELANASGREPNAAELARELGEPPEKVAEMRRLSQPASSLDAPVETTSLREQDANAAAYTLGSLVSDEGQSGEAEAAAELATVRARVWNTLEVLGERERHVIVRRYGLDGARVWTLQELANELGVRKEGVRRLQKRAEERMAQALGAGDAA